MSSQQLATTNWVAVTSVALAVFMAALDMSIVNVSLPTLSATFAVPPSQMSWMVLAYNLPLVALVVPFGRWADRIDRGRAFVVGVLGFGAASALVALSPVFSVLLVARFVQGVFGS